MATPPDPIGRSGVPWAVWAVLSIVFGVLFLVLLFQQSIVLAIVCLVVTVLCVAASSRGVLADRR